MRASRTILTGACQAPALPFGPQPERRLAGERAVLILDARGAVQFCSDAAAQLLDGTAEQMLGRPIGSLFLELPLRILTPGYNLAYACFWSVHHEWRRFHRSLEGRRPLELRLNTAQRRQDVPHALVVGLRAVTE